MTAFAINVDNHTEEKVGAGIQICYIVPTLQSYICSGSHDSTIFFFGKLKRACYIFCNLRVNLCCIL